MNVAGAIATDFFDVARAGGMVQVGYRPAADDHHNSPDLAGELLRTIAHVPDIRTVFPRVSEIAKQVLPHDCLELVVHDQAGQPTLQARSADDLPDYRRCLVTGENELDLVSDLRKSRPRLAACDPPDFLDRLVSAGYRSFVNVRHTARPPHIRLAFFSKRAGAYAREDVAEAQRIADSIAVAVSHEQLAEAEWEMKAAREREERLLLRVRMAIDDPDLMPGRGRVIGESAAWRSVLLNATRVAPTETTVFLQGQSGTGKEVVARFIHRTSPRKRGPFVAINCAALPDTLLESELFGFERGAFTGAHQAKAGQIELASGGVLFLDEVSEMSPMAQAKLLRFLQEREFQRLGGTRLLKANVRVIAASNRDLREAVAQRTFREDLFYRLQVFDIAIPSLRERASDIPLLAEAFLEEFSKTMGGPPATLTRGAQQELLAHPWPGNVRELRNVLERAAILADGGLITSEHLSLPAHSASTLPATTDICEMERRTIEQVMRETGWNKSRAAGRLGLTRTQLYVRLRRYGLALAMPEN